MKNASQDFLFDFPDRTWSQQYCKCTNAPKETGNRYYSPELSRLPWLPCKLPCLLGKRSSGYGLGTRLTHSASIPKPRKRYCIIWKLDYFPFPRTRRNAYFSLWNSAIIRKIHDLKRWWRNMYSITHIKNSKNDKLP